MLLAVATRLLESTGWKHSAVQRMSCQAVLKLAPQAYPPTTALNSVQAGGRLFSEDDGTFVRLCLSHLESGIDALTEGSDRAVLSESCCQRMQLCYSKEWPR